MKTTKTSRKFDFRFFAVIALALAAVFALIVLVSGAQKGQDLPVSELPEEMDNHIPKLVINEVMTSNGGIWVSPDNETSDYIEIYNGSGKTVNLKGYGLSDRKNVIKWTFPEYELINGGYLVIALTGETEEGFQAPFKLSSAGAETVILTNASGKVIDAVDTVPLGKNQVMARNENGAWQCVSEATPGYENSRKGRTAYLNSLSADADFASYLIISEILPKNKGNFVNEYGRYEGFIELYNSFDAPLDLGGCYISDDPDLPFKTRLPSVLLAPGAYYVIKCGNARYGEEGYAGFNLNANNGSVTLTYKGTVLQALTYSGLENGYAYARNEAGQYEAKAVCSPGHANTPDGIEAFQKANLIPPKGLIISEVMSRNSTVLAQNGANYYDWIELYNNGSEDVDLSKYCLSTDANHLGLYVLPARTLKPGEYLVLMCSGDEKLTNQSYIHIPFKLSDCEGVYLSLNGKIADALFYGDIPANMTYSRSLEEGLFYTQPTPGAKNACSDACRFVASAPEFSLSGGVFNNTDGLKVEILGPGEIRYTTDGSVPTQSSALYTGPLTLNATTVLKARCFGLKSVPSQTAFSSYIINENHTLPVMSVTIAPTDFTYLNGHPNSYVERQAWAEFYESFSSFSIPCSLALFGGNTRFISKKSYALRFDSEWGASSLNYPVFENRDNSCYDALVLRSGSTDYKDSIIRDIVGTSLVDDYCDVDVQAYKPCILYINGQYWGIYNIREKINSHFLKEHYNVEVDDLDLMRLDGETKVGSRKRYNDIRQFVNTHDLAVEANYQELLTMIDLENVVDYWIAELYFTNNDILNCRFFICDTISDGKLKYIFYDLDYAWYNIAMNYYTRYLTNPDGIGINYNYENTIIRNLFKNKSFRSYFLERLSYHAQNTFHPDTVLARINEIYELYLPEIERNQKRWGLSVEHWKDEVQNLRNWAVNRPTYLMRDTKAFFGLNDTEMKEVFGDLWK